MPGNKGQPRHPDRPDQCKGLQKSGGMETRGLAAGQALPRLQQHACSLHSALEEKTSELAWQRVAWTAVSDDDVAMLEQNPDTPISHCNTRLCHVGSQHFTATLRVQRHAHMSERFWRGEVSAIEKVLFP